MSYPTPDSLQLPLEPYAVAGYSFGESIKRSWFFLPAVHLGDDILAPAKTPIKAIGDGLVVWSKVHPGSATHKSWGGLVVIGHTHQKTGLPFFSVYGHLFALTQETGVEVIAGQGIGAVAAGLTAVGGWWQQAHLHFGIYTGPWRNNVLPGHWRLEERRTKKKWWHDPRSFIKEYNQA